MSSISELKKLIKLVKENRIGKLKTRDFEIEVHPATYSLEYTISALPQDQTPKTKEQPESKLPPEVSDADLVGPFPSF